MTFPSSVRFSTFTATPDLFTTQVSVNGALLPETYVSNSYFLSVPSSVFLFYLNSPVDPFSSSAYLLHINRDAGN